MEKKPRFSNALIEGVQAFEKLASILVVGTSTCNAFLEAIIGCGGYTCFFLRFMHLPSCIVNFQAGSCIVYGSQTAKYSQQML